MAPNPIDFDYVFSQFPNIFESGNVVVLATVLSIFGLYIIGLVIARRADRKDERKVRSVPPFLSVTSFQERPSQNNRNKVSKVFRDRIRVATT